MIDLQIR